MTDADILAIPGGGACPQPKDLEMAVRRVGDQVHRLNQAVTAAVEAGGTVELVRCSRYHGGNGRWGDQLVPMVRMLEDRR